MSIQIINTGSSANARDGDSLRAAFTKVNNNFAGLISVLNTFTGNTGTSLVTIHGGPPQYPVSGTLWFDEFSGKLFVYYDSTWVDANPNEPAAGYTGSRGSQGNQGVIGYTGSRGAYDAVGYTGSRGSGFNDLTSTSTLSISLGTKTFITNINAADSGFVAGSVVSVRALASPNGSYGFGALITSFVGNTLTLSATGLTGSGTYSDWAFSIAGVRGFTGSVGYVGSRGIGYNDLTSTSTIDITFEDKTFVTSINAADSGFVTGSVVSARALASPGGAYGFGGIINSFIGNTLTITTTGLTGSGIYSDWEFSIAGVRGFTGSRGPSSIVPSSQSGALAFYYNSGTTIVGDPGLTIANNALRIGSTSSNIVDLLVMRESIPNLNNDLNNGIKLRQQFDSSLSAAISLIKSRGSRSNPTVLQKNDIVGRLGFVGYDGVNFQHAAGITVTVDKTPEVGVSMPARMVFGVNLPGGDMTIGGSMIAGAALSSSAEWQIDRLGTYSTTTSSISVSTSLIPNTNNTYDLGSSNSQWRSLYVSTNTIYINNIPVSVDNSGILLVNGAPITGSSNQNLNTNSNATFNSVTISGTSIGFPDGSRQTSAYRLVSPPAHNTSTGVIGNIAIDGSYIYTCVNTNTWVRSTITGSW
jgi:hypothetical protein